jgi:Ser/Thr protein kinase RdoA (MazF antagonist)
MTKMATDGHKLAFDDLLKTYLSLGDSAGTIVRKLKKTPNPDNRSKLVRELRSLDRKRLELLDQMDDLAKST